MVTVLDSGSRGPGSSPDRSLCCVFEQDTLLSQCLSPPRSICALSVDQACSVKMAGYWPSSFLRFYGPRRI